MKQFNPEYITYKSLNGGNVEQSQCADLAAKYRELHALEIELEQRKLNILIQVKDARTLVNDSSQRLVVLESEMARLQAEARRAFDSLMSCISSDAAMNAGEPAQYCHLLVRAENRASQNLHSNKEQYRIEKERWDRFNQDLKVASLALDQILKDLDRCDLEKTLVMEQITKRCPKPWPWEVIES